VLLFSHAWQYIFSDESFSKPYFLTYISASCFSTYMIGFLFKKKWIEDLKELVHRRQRKQRSIQAVGPEEDVEALLEGAVGATDENNQLNMEETFSVALKFFIIWFIANYIYK
jgi:hypothetical protein